MSKFAKGIVALVVLGALAGAFIQIQLSQNSNILMAEGDKWQKNEPVSGGGSGGGGGGGSCLNHCIDPNKQPGDNS
jgi:hypothetical protein